MKATRLILACLVLAGSLLGGAGCTRVNNATQIGGTEPATWVYIGTNNERRNGVFRCALVEGAQRPICVRAEMQY